MSIKCCAVAGALLVSLAAATASATAHAKPSGELNAEMLVRAVLRQNAGLSAQRSAAEAARAAIYPAGALDDPMLTLGIAPQTLGADRTSARELGQISQAFPWPGTLRVRQRAARSMAESAALQADDYRLQLAAKARAAYATWTYVFRAIAINDREQVLLKRLTRVAEAAFASGQAPEQDVLRAQVEATRLENQAIELRRRRSQVQAAINGLLNREPDAPVPEPAGFASTGTLPAFEHIREMALARYPRLRELDARVAARQDQVSLARKKYYPNFKLLTGYNGVMDPSVKRWTVGVAINLPFDFEKRNAWLDAANAKLRESRSRRLELRARLLRDLQQAYAAADQARRSLRLYSDRLLPLSRLDLQAAQDDYGAGRGSFLDVITAEQRYLMAELERARAEADLSTQIAVLDYQTGGALLSAPYPAAKEIER